MDSSPQPGRGSARDHYRKALEDTIGEDNFTADATRARIARFQQAPPGHSVHTTPTSNESPSARDPGFRPVLGGDGSRQAPVSERFELGKVLGRGGSGQVFAARDRTLNRDIAVKVLYPDIATNAVRMERFINEARITAKLEHPNILPIYDLEKSADGGAYFSMRVAKGISLGEAIRQIADSTSVPPQIATVKDRISVFLKILDAVAFAHHQGVIHQDIKPDNIMLGEFGEVVVVDWGTAIARETREDRQNRLVGTPAYMSPEQARRECADERSDVYCLGATFFHMLTLRHPTWESDPDKFWQKKRQGEIDPPTPEEHEKVPTPLLDLALKALAPDPAQRFQSVNALRGAIIEYQQYEESINLQLSAKAIFTAAVASRDYMAFNQALFGYQQALKLWAGNAAASQGISETKLRYAECAIQKGDLELAASTLDPADATHEPARKQIALAREQRAALRRRTRRMQYSAAALALLLLGFVGYFAFDYFRYFGEWKQVYQQTFTSKNADVKGLFFSGGDWNEEKAPPATGPDGFSVQFGQMFWMRDLRLHGDVRVEVALRWPEAIDGFDIFMNASNQREGSPYGTPAGHIGQFGGYQNTLNFISPQETCGTPSHASAVGCDFKPGVVYHVAFQRQGDELTLWVDGKRIHRHMQLLPVTRAGFEHIGFRSWTVVDVLSITVSRLSMAEKSSPLIAGDALYAEGYHTAALRAYREVARDFRGRPLGEQALARAYLTTYSHIESEEAVRARTEIKGEISASYPQSEYWTKLLESDCASAWQAQRYAEALGLLPEIFQRDPETRIILQLLSLQHLKLPPDVATGLLTWAAKTRHVDYLALERLDIRDLAPIAGMKLTRIDLLDNQVKSLEPLRGMPLTALNFNTNLVSDLSPLHGMPLKQLMCPGNCIESLEPLRGMPLARLECNGNRITTLEPLRGVPLQRLYCDNNLIASLQPLTGMALKALRCQSNPIADLSPLHGMPLESLDASQMKIKDVEALKGLPLTDLAIVGNEIKSLSGLEDAPLSRLDCSSCQVGDLSPLAKAPLTDLRCASNRISDLEALRGSKLTDLDARENQIASIEPLRGMSLSTLNLSRNRISSLEPLRGAHVGSINVSYNPVTDISPLTGMTLWGLDANGIKLSSLEPIAGKSPVVVRFDWENLEAPYFETLVQNWAKTAQDPRTVLRMRVSRLIRTGKFDQLRALSSEFKGHHYLVSADWAHWDEAHTLAEKAGGHLVTIGSREEEVFVAGLLMRQESFWIGLLSTPSGEAWVTGEPVQFTNYRLLYGQRKSGHWMMFHYQSDAFWFTVDKEAGGLTVIEWDN